MRGRELKWEELSEKEKGYLFGLFEGDGYKVYDKNSRHYHVEFYLNSEKDKKIISFLVSLLNKINLNPNLYQDKRYNCKRIRVYSKGLFSILERKDSVEKEKEEFILGFISGLIDSEGNVNKKKSYISVVSTSKEILYSCSKFLKKKSIVANINKRKPSKKDKKSSYRMYISVKFKRLNHLSIKTKRLQ